MAGKHLHLAWWGYITCTREPCPLPVADPAGDADCTDPDCEGGCGAARFNAQRRRPCATQGSGNAFPYMKPTDTVPDAVTPYSGPPATLSRRTSP
jgi:hypothetical protein